jgi:hypothetical protein
LNKEEKSKKCQKKVPKKVMWKYCSSCNWYLTYFYGSAQCTVRWTRRVSVV